VFRVIPFPYNLLATLALLAGAFFSGWTTQGWHRDSLEKDNAEQKLAEVRSNAAASVRRVENVIQATNAAAARERGLRADAAGARNELDRLRDVLQDYERGTAGIPPASCPDRAIALSDVLQECAGRYSGLAEKADRHASDLQTLMDAWPK